MDKLEKYILENRTSFDDKMPSKDLWHKINGDLDKGEVKQVSFGNYIWRAAAVILFAVVVGLLIERNDVDNSGFAGLNMGYESEFSFNEVEDYYFQVIGQKQETIARFIEKNPDVDKNILGEIDQLDSTYQVLKNNLKDVNNEKIVDAMVINLQMRIDILNRQLSVLERLQNKDKDETTNI